MIFLSSLLFTSCKVNKANLESEAPKTPFNDERSFNSIYNASAQNIAGTWTMIGMDSFKTFSNLEKEAAIIPGDVIWNFYGETGHYGSLNIMDQRPLSDLKEKSPNQSSYWTENCLLQLDHKKYIYKITEIHDQSGKAIARELTLRDNLDLSIADEGSTIRFRSMDAFFACGTTSGEVNSKPQFASLINGIVLQAYTEEEAVDGTFKLVDYQAYTSEENLPSYKGEQVIWEFKNNSLEVKKENDEIKNDYSLDAGKYSVWKDRCLIQIGRKIYYYAMQEIEGENGEKQMMLHLNSGMEPNIADEEQHYYFIKI